ncbi:hypothetical protein NP233_g12846 [Leucocoprinus birnbaumii]|uniref:DUF6532 domain-containing protein n=1 Tax=Leucocoprinus birnbaumii TaxID=56174 RepID=A0AAD5VG67_9AGAR|nr:hypothetical protein NP233_g12846 [Leucocoprinus birnbaumii]
MLRAIQRATEYRARIAKDIKNAVRVHLIDTCGDSSPSSIQEYVDLLLENGKARYMWKTTDLESLTGTFEGLFLAPYIIAGISSHLEMTAGLPDELTVSTYPQGALALATVAAERALKGWVNGRDTIGEDLSNKKNEEFSETLWGTATKTVMTSIKKISAKKWQKILSAVTEAIPQVHSTPKLCKAASVDTEDARALAYEPNSD